MEHDIYAHLDMQPDHGEMHIRKVEDMHVGMRLRKLYPNGDEEEWEIVKGPARFSELDDSVIRAVSDLCNEWCVITKITNTYKTYSQPLKFLADAGVVPYANNKWARAYLVRID